MDANRFDHLSRSLASSTTRRRALLGGSGLLAGALAVVGRPRAESLAQNDAATCALDLVATVRLGPSKDTDLGEKKRGQLRGTLRFAVGENGQIVNGVFHRADNTQWQATGQLTGQAITVRLPTQDDGLLVLVGAGESPFRVCDGAADGLMNGPAQGDLGDWHAVASRSGGQSPANQPTESTGNTGASNSGNSNGSQPTHAASGKQPSAAPTQAPQDTPTMAANKPPVVATKPPVVQVTPVNPPVIQCIQFGGSCTSDDDCCSGNCVHGSKICGIGR